MAAPVGAMLDLWSAALREGKARLRPLFRHPSVADSAAAFLDGLPGPERRKTGWMRAEAAGDPGPRRQQAALGRSVWGAEALRDAVRGYVVEALASPGAAPVIDETGSLKQGRASCGVARQYTGSAGEITNCQIGVSAAHVSEHGHAFIDRRLYLPRGWTSDPERRAAAGVPAGVGFATKPALATALIERTIAAGVPFAWVAADSVYGVGEIEVALRRAGKGYVLGVTGRHRFWSVGRAPDHRRHTRRARRGAAGFRLGAPVGRRGHEGPEAPRLGLPRTRRPHRRRGRIGGARRLDARAAHPARRRRREPRLLLDLVPGRHARRETLVAVEGRRWAIEDAFGTAKTELGLAHNGTRSWRGWHRHVSLVMLAFAMLAAVRHRATSLAPEKSRDADELRRRCAGPSRRSGASPCA